MSTSTPDIIFELAGVSIGSTLGAAFIGFSFATLLYGVTCCQALYYFRSYKSKNDGWSLKGLVATLCVMDTVHEGVIMHMVYHYLVKNYDNPLSFFTVVWSVSTEILLNTVIGVTVQTFFVHRIWKFSHNIWIAAFCGLWNVAALATGLVFPIKIYLVPLMEVAERSFRPFSLAGICVALTGDVIITLTISYYLYRSRTGFRKSDDMLTKLIVLTVTTGGLTTCVLAANLVAFVAAPLTLYDLAFNPVISKLYTNSLLAMLNSRGFITGEADDQTTRITKPFAAPQAHSSFPSDLSVLVSRTIETDVSIEKAPSEIV